MSTLTLKQALAIIDKDIALETTKAFDAFALNSGAEKDVKHQLTVLLERYPEKVYKPFFLIYLSLREQYAGLK